MKFFSTKVFIILTAFTLGVASALVASRYINFKIEKPVGDLKLSLNDEPVDFFDNFFNEDYFGRSRDPFEEMRRMQKQMLNRFEKPDRFKGNFDNWYQKRFGGGEVNEITQREDDKYVYYELDIKELAPKDLKVEVKEGQINITGQFESKNEENGASQYISSSFHRSLPVPPNVAAEKFNIEQVEKKIILKFPKK